jgi:hypothetical protein
VRLVVAVLLLSAGCRQLFGIETTTLRDGGDGGGGGDVSDGVDALDAAPGCTTISDPALTFCLSQPVTDPLTMTTVFLNTQAASSCPFSQGGGASVCIIAGTTIDIPNGAAITSHGNRPILFYATTSITIEGLVDVASHIGGSAGPNSNAAGCNAGAAPLGDAGGAGGSFGGKGGNGGDGNGNAGGVAGAGIAATTLRGGCAGETGGTGGFGGVGGGAVLFYAPSITLSSGVINASGSSGFGAPISGHGGGGGGSGGMIAFYASTMISVDVQSKVYANGGHGGGGSGGAGAGMNGTDPANPASGGGNGQGGANGGDGGSGYPVVQNGLPGIGMDGGGGGGGAPGAIRMVSPSKMLSGSISPPAT